MVDYTPIAPNSAEPEVAVNAALASFKAAIDLIEAGGALPEGGIEGQLLSVGADGLEWVDAPEAEFPPGGTTGQALVRAAGGGVEWMTIGGGSGLPAGGTTGQVLTKNSTTDGDASWATPASGGGGGGTISIVTAKRNNGYIWPIPNDWNAVPYEALINQDIAGVWSVADPTKFFVPAGKTRIRFTAFFVFDSNGGEKYIHLLDKNNQNVGARRPGVPTQSLWYVGAGRAGNNLVSRWLEVAEGDWFTLKVFSASGNLFAGPANGYPFCQVELA